MLHYYVSPHSDPAGGKRVKDFAIEIGHPASTAVAPVAEPPPLAAPVRVTCGPVATGKRLRAVALGLALMAHAAVLYALSRERDVAGRGGQLIDTISVTIVSSSLLDARQPDLAQPNAYVPISAAVARRKVAHLQRHFFSQAKKDWFGADTFLGLMRLRGMESRSPSGFAEAFHARKLVL